MKKILLIQAISMEGIDIERVYPIGIVTLASCIEKSSHYTLDIFDMNMAIDPYGDLKERLLSFNPDIIGISLRNVDPLGNRTTSLIVPFAITLSFIRRYLPKVTLLAGGTAFSLFPERLMNEFPEIDLGVSGEAEEIILPLLDNIDNPPKLPGLVYRENGQVQVIPPTGKFDMNNYTMPNRNLLDPKKYLEVNKYVESIGVETKRGCCYNCGYCSYPLLSGCGMRCRNPKSVVDEIEFLNKEYGVSRIHLTDSIVNFPVNHLDEICQEILKRKLHIHWSGFFRENLLTEKNARLYADSGCECFSLSPDGLSQNALDIMEKHLTIDEILHTAKVLSTVGITAVYHFLVNTPGDTWKTIDEGKALIDQIYNIHGQSKTIGTIVLNLIRIMPRTKVEKLALENGVITPKTDLLYPVYYDPDPFRTVRYDLEVYHNKKNIFMWNEMDF
ncbi:MAG: B12 lower ligand biosynthesis radical SAM protein BzaD [Eubacterium sp.]